MNQTPLPGTNLLTHCGDTITFTLTLSRKLKGKAILRTSIGGAKTYRKEVISSIDEGRQFLAKDWNDIPMKETSDGVYEVRIPLADIGTFRAKTCFFEEGSSKPIWPDGGDVVIKTAPAWTSYNTSVYTTFPRQFLSSTISKITNPNKDSSETLAKDAEGWTIIPPSGTFRDVIRKLETILGVEGFRIIQLLPIHPTPTTYARMGRYGSPFAGTDFMSVDPSLAEFDKSATPLDQFRELVNATHAYGARIFLDLPANHTGWASSLQTHHPEWFKRVASSSNNNPNFKSPGAWGIVWEDLVELDYSKPELRKFMAEVFEFWCSQGVDGFRCDAGYMVPAEVWRYIVARVRTKFPDTVFLLEGLGGKISVTRQLIAEEGLDWAYSEMFQTEDRSAFEHYLPNALTMSAEVGPLTNFAETHDNNRMAAKSTTYAKMRTALAALSSHQGCFGITNGVEWFATEKVDVHGASALNWGAEENQVSEISRLNTILSTHKAFGAGASVKLIQYGAGNSLAILRTQGASHDINSSHKSFDNNPSKILVLANLDDTNSQSVSWNINDFDASNTTYDLLTNKSFVGFYKSNDGTHTTTLSPGEVLCLTHSEEELSKLEELSHLPRQYNSELVRHQELRSVALRIRSNILGINAPLSPLDDVDEMAHALSKSPENFIESLLPKNAFPPITNCNLPEDKNRIVMIPPGHFTIVRSPKPFMCSVTLEDNSVISNLRSNKLEDGSHAIVLSPFKLKKAEISKATLNIDISEKGPAVKCNIELRLLPQVKSHKDTPVKHHYTSDIIRNSSLVCLLTNGRGAMSHVHAKWGEINSQYDAILAANPDPNVPCDRHMLFTKCNIWVVNNGFSIELNEACLQSFDTSVGKGFACWHFNVPVGTGQHINLDIVLHLHKDENRSTLYIYRRSSSDDTESLSDENEVQIIIRPDIESRSFHQKTKAFTGPEREWGNAIHPYDNGFEFTPYNLPGLNIFINNGKYINEPEWHYMISHKQEADRGQDGSSDLYSPGWFSTSLEGDKSIMLTATMLPAQNAWQSVDPATEKALFEATKLSSTPLSLRQTLSNALNDFIVKRESLMTVIAGYPWFLDWGRDTFIAMRGMIADGHIKESIDIIKKFGQFEEAGTLPNMINGNNAANRDTSDAQLWYIVAVNDLINHMGNDDILKMDCGNGRTVKNVIESIVNGYINGTPNGIKVDEESFLVFSPSHFTWMDTNYPAGTPREGYPIEIQSLWVAALKFMDKTNPNCGWDKKATLASESIEKYFWNDEREFLSDCLHAHHGTSAANAIADDHLRCNQLFAITLDAISNKAIRRAIIKSSSALLVPGGIRTLAPHFTNYKLPIYGAGGMCLNDPNNPYWGRYEGDEDTRRKPAYHNGTAWTWPYPSYAEAIFIEYGKSAKESAKAFIASGIELMQRACIGQLPEIMDGDAPHTSKGCDAQAWGVSEFLRLATILDM